MNNNLFAGIVDMLSAKSEKMIEQSLPLAAFQEEVDRRLSNAADQADRLAIIDIMFQCFRSELHEELKYLNKLLDLVGNNQGRINSSASR
ncbi:hypothetical protein [uncultured Desulfosarcina sp.]|uniref:hypothetical protein n=1 Tax=uncultured Desulfosarcina sp. TaxID=218289 RepID=UPI0029C7B861|nr:hypothetical protein [uncultured Desulfosarcina sp.]